MTTEIFEDPAELETITVGCKVCHNPKLAQRDWWMHSQATLRNGCWGVLSSWSYVCLTCKSVIVVRYWKPTPTEPIPFAFD